MSKEELSNVANRVRSSVAQRYPAERIERVAMPTQMAPPMLASFHSSSLDSTSSLEMWENNLEERLDSIEHDIAMNKLGAQELQDMLSRGKIEDMNF